MVNVEHKAMYKTQTGDSINEKSIKIKRLNLVYCLCTQYWHVHLKHCWSDLSIQFMLKQLSDWGLCTLTSICLADIYLGNISLQMYNDFERKKGKSSHIIMRILRLTLE